VILFYALFYTYLNAYLKRCPEMITDFITPKNTITKEFIRKATHPHPCPLLYES